MGFMDFIMSSSVAFENRAIEIINVRSSSTYNVAQ